MSWFRKSYRLISIVLITIIPFIILFSFRNIDDNRLTSWKWVFAQTDPVWFVVLLLCATITVLVLFRTSLTEDRAGLFLLLFSFAAAIPFWEAPEAIIDASRYFTQAKHLEIYGVWYFISEWGKSIHAWTDLPLIPFLYGMIFKLFGESRVYIQVFTTLLFSFTVVLTYLIGKTLWDKRTGYYGGLFLMGIPYIFSQVPLMLVDVPVMFFLTLSIFTFIRAMEKGGAWTGYASLAISCAVFSKYSVWIMLTVLAVIVLVYLIQGHEVRRQIVCRAFLTALGAGLITGIVFLFKFDLITGQLQFLREYQMPGLSRWGENYISTFFYQMHPFITFAALYSLIRAFRERDLKFLIVSWMALLMLILQVKRSRYLLIVFPMITLMASYGLCRIKSMEIKRYIVSSVVASSLVIGVFAYLPFLKSMSMSNFTSAGNYLNSINAKQLEVFTIASRQTVVNSATSVPILDLFANAQINYIYDTGVILPPEEVETSPLRFTWDYTNPEYYKSSIGMSTEKSAVAVISNDSDYELPENIMQKIRGFKKAEVFKTSTGIFRYSPVITIYLPYEKPS